MRARLLKLPAIGLPCRILGSVTPEWAWTRLTGFVTGGAKAPGSPDPAPQKPIASSRPILDPVLSRKNARPHRQSQALVGIHTRI